MAPLMAAGIFYYVFNTVVAVVMDRLERLLSAYKI